MHKDIFLWIAVVIGLVFLFEVVWRQLTNGALVPFDPTIRSRRFRRLRRLHRRRRMNAEHNKIWSEYP